MKTLLKIKFPVLLLLAFFSVSVAKAQPGAKKEKVEALRISFITQQLDLGTQEAQLFWPVYNEYLDKLDAARKAFRQQYNKQTDFDFKTDKEADAYLNAEINLKQKEADYFREYYEKFKKVLPVKKVAKLRRAEEEFKKKLIEQLQGKATD
ncbi:MAG: hypothetical protein ACJ76F_09315 [Bacteroidia bacterium]